MEQAQQHGVQGGQRRPALGEENLPQRGKIGHFSHAAPGGIGHQHDGQRDFIGGQAQQKSG